jgi:hypothetical protein
MERTRPGEPQQEKQQHRDTAEPQLPRPLTLSVVGVNGILWWAHVDSLGLMLLRRALV